MPTPSPSTARDPRVDLLRGLSLLSIFVDHTPGNRLAGLTLRNFGFSDAAELFVILAGYSATLAYSRVFERDGIGTGLKKVLLRCLQIYGVQVGLLLLTLLFVSQWEELYGMEATIVRPMLRDGWHGAMRGVSLQALPANLDILPLYIVLLAAFPLIRLGLAYMGRATVAVSILLYVVANVTHLNLPNAVDPLDAVHWYFNPFTWQLIFVFGCVLATGRQRRVPVMTEPPVLLRAACWAYLVLAFLALDAWALWPNPFGADFSGTSPALAMFGNEPKTFVSPWRLCNVLAMTFLALTSPTLASLARHAILKPVLACGRNSLQVFALGCIVALVGRLTFRSYGVTTLTQVLVNTIGLGSMLLLGVILDRIKAGRLPDRGGGVQRDVGRRVKPGETRPPATDPRPVS